ncbi:MAG: tyrosine recombinase XerC [Bacteroidaceae bacterium]|nr:tyrosine recombinase XerC [Bacteroidaceae bacterium]
MLMIEGFLNYLTHERAYSPHTVTSYGNDLREFEAYLANTENVLKTHEADADLIRGWAMELMAAGRSATTVNRKLSSLRTYYKYLLKKGAIAISPMQSVHGPKKKKPLPQFVRESDMERLLDDTLTDDSWQGRREHVIIQLFYETGIRLSELVGLNVGDVDLVRKTIKVTGKRNKQRIIPIGDSLAQNLKVYVEEKDVEFGLSSTLNPQPLFITDKGARVYPAWVYRLVRKNLSQVVTLKKRSPHVLRHTFATAMLNGDAELEAVKELMGHESVSTTQIYTHTTFEELKKAYSKAHPRASINQ